MNSKRQTTYPRTYLLDFLSFVRLTLEAVFDIAMMLFAGVVGHLIYAVLLPVYVWRHRHGDFSWAEAFGYRFPGRGEPVTYRFEYRGDDTR